MVLTVGEDSVVALADREATAAISRSGLDSLLLTPDGFWGRSRYPD